jgi:hypothetical protein
VARGDTQNATITVTDSNRRAVANAQIDGKLIYPGKILRRNLKEVPISRGNLFILGSSARKVTWDPLS